MGWRGGNNALNPHLLSSSQVLSQVQNNKYWRAPTTIVSAQRKHDHTGTPHTLTSYNSPRKKTTCTLNYLCW